MTSGAAIIWHNKTDDETQCPMVPYAVSLLAVNTYEILYAIAFGQPCVFKRHLQIHPAALWSCSNVSYCSPSIPQQDVRHRGGQSQGCNCGQRASLGISFHWGFFLDTPCTNIHSKYLLYIYIYGTPPTYLFVVFTGICSKLYTFWAYIVGCSFGSCFGWLVGGAIYIYK